MNQVPKHQAALYFNELAPISGQSERCALFGQFYHLPDPDIRLTRPVVALPENSWGVVSDQDVNDIVCGGAYFESAGVRKLIAIFQSGEARIYQGSQFTKIKKPEDVGFLSGVRLIDNELYVCGSQNRVYKLINFEWTNISETIGVAYGGPEDPILNSIDGFSSTEIYSVGYNGSIVRYDGEIWKPIYSSNALPLTHQHLNQVIAHTDGFMYACGANGVILKGRLDNWNQFSIPDTMGCLDDFWGLASFQGNLYFSSYHRLFKITNDEIIEITKEVNSAEKFYRLASNLSYLWITTGTGKIFRFDQKQWLGLIWPDNI